MKNTGVVYLIGAGPGDPGLMTEKGLARLMNCDALVYDSLVSDRFLDMVPDTCQKIYVGKRAGCHSMKQEEINRLLVELALKGLRVVRLKGGDPFVFGRGGEEILTLKEAKIPYEVVSGVTSAVAALASAGIPVTHRALSRSFHVMTGHTLAKDGTLPPDFDAFARLSGTLIFLMGLGNLPIIVEGLIKQGKSKDTPAAVIQNGTLPEQKTVRGTLSDIEQRVLAEGIKSPAIIVAGECAALDFSSTAKQPLNGCQIGVTGTPGFTKRLRKELEAQGGITKCLLDLRLKSYRTDHHMIKAYKKLSSYNWIVFTSANAVREFFTGLMEWGGDLRFVGHVKFAAIGSGTAKELLHYGFRADYIPDKYQVKDLALGLRDLITQEEKVLIPRSKGGSKELNQIFDEAGLCYDDIVLYEVACNKQGTEKWKETLGSIDYLTFASASGVRAFFKEADEEIIKFLSKCKVLCIGEITAKALKKFGREADIIAEIYSVEGIIDAICKDWTKERNGEDEN